MVFWRMSIYVSFIFREHRLFYTANLFPVGSRRGMKNSIKVERARNNMTQAELAEKVKVARQTIIAIRGKFVPSTTLAFKIATILNCRTDNIFELEDEDWQ